MIRKSYTEIIESYYGCLGVLQFFPGKIINERNKAKRIYCDRFVCPLAR